LGPPSTTLPASLAGKVITRLPTQQKLVALTFDAGAGAQGAPAILATLAATDTPATFFLTGRFSEGNGALARTIASRGYVIGNHSLTHPHFTALSDAAVRIEVTGAAGDVTAATGRDPRPWFRFPYGDYDARTLADVNALGYAAIGWTVDTLGWEGTSGGISVNTVLSRVMSNLQPGEIVLMHVGANPNDGSTLDAQALPQIISSIRAAGYGFTTLSGLAAGG
jgi:peptidoglycan/xylan/chitin deacetylase (PgdA/CDA1 family)